jgi:hypothetical protein
MATSRTGKCLTCRDNDVELEWLPLYIIGSEGAWICLPCKLILTEVAKGMMMASSRAAMDVHKSIRLVTSGSDERDI